MRALNELGHMPGTNLPLGNSRSNELVLDYKVSNTDTIFAAISL